MLMSDTIGDFFPFNSLQDDDFIRVIERSNDLQSNLDNYTSLKQRVTQEINTLTFNPFLRWPVRDISIFFIFA